MTYHIKLDRFEGPLDLLLSLIEERKLDITRLSLADVTDQYLEYIENKEAITLGNMAEFILVASRLILIKSKALLPLLELDQEEEEEIKDLEYQLREYKKFKEVTPKVKGMFLSARRGFTREGFLGIGSFFYPPENINVYDFKKYFVTVLNGIPTVEKFEEEVVKEVVTLEDKINHLQALLKERIETSFSELVSRSEDKIEVIVSFLAMLEMVKQRIVFVEQVEIFEEIRMRHII